MSAITKNHWIELIIRTMLFISTVVVQFIDKIASMGLVKAITYCVVWLFFFVKMIIRTIPKKIESMGNQKIFLRNYIPTGKKIVKDNKSAIVVAAVWLGLNSVFWVLHMFGIISKDFMFILCMLFAVCDLICVLIFCPFQKWFMKNKCCNTCRIYNWDFAMMFTPLIVVPNIFNYSLVIMSWIVLAQWEILHKRFPERFYEKTNENLKCANCKEFMCKNKLRLVKENKH